MKIQPAQFALASMAALSLACLPTLNAQTTTSTPTNPNGSEANSKSAETSAAQVRNNSTGTGTTAATTPDKASSKDTTNSLDKNPSTRPTDSANSSATKDPTTATTMNDRSSHSEKHDSTDAFSDKHFLVKAAQGGMTEVQLGEIAAKKGDSANVKEFGTQMAADHSKVNAELKGLAEQKGVTVPDKLDAKHQAMVDKLNSLSGKDFDKAYISDMVEAHQKDAAEFQKASSAAQDTDVQAFANKTLTTVIQPHLTHVESLQSQVK